MALPQDPSTDPKCLHRYDLGVEFDSKPELEVHNEDGSLVVSRQEDPPGVVGYWHVFDFAQPAARPPGTLEYP